MKNPVITLDLFLKVLRCSKSAYLVANNPELNYNASVNPIPEASEILMDKLCSIISPKGINIKKNAADIEDMIAKTESLSHRKQFILNYATYVTANQEIAIIHTLQKENKTTAWFIKTTPGNIYATEIMSAAYQYHVLMSKGIKVDNFLLVHLKSDYINTGAVNNNLINCTSILPQCRKLQPEVKEYLTLLKRTLQRNKAPEITIGYQCKRPDCMFIKNCWSHIAKGNVFELTDQTFPQQYRLYQTGNLMFNKLGSYVKLSASDRIQVNTTNSGTIYQDIPAIRNFLNKISSDGFIVLTIAFAQMPWPEYVGSSPFSYLPFHYCIGRSSNSILAYEPYTINIEGKYDNRKALIVQLLKRLNSFPRHSIITHSVSFLRLRLKEFELWYPDLKKEIRKTTNRLIDCQSMLKEKAYYHPSFYGRYDFWTVMKVFAPDYPTQDLKIFTKRGAQQIYFQILNGSAKVYKQDLEQYSIFNLKAIYLLMQNLQSAIK